MYLSFVDSKRPAEMVGESFRKSFVDRPNDLFVTKVKQSLAVCASISLSKSFDFASLIE